MSFTHFKKINYIKIENSKELFQIGEVIEETIFNNVEFYYNALDKMD